GKQARAKIDIGLNYGHVRNMLQVSDTRRAQNSKNGTRIFALKDKARASNASFRRGTTSSRLTLSQDENKCRTYRRLSAFQGSDECIGALCCHFRASRTHRASRRWKC